MQYAFSGSFLKIIRHPTCNSKRTSSKEMPPRVLELPPLINKCSPESRKTLGLYSNGNVIPPLNSVRTGRKSSIGSSSPKSPTSTMTTTSIAISPLEIPPGRKDFNPHVKSPTGNKIQSTIPKTKSSRPSKKSAVALPPRYDANIIKSLRDYFLEMDTDGDGKVSRQEFRSSYERRKKETRYSNFFSDDLFDILDKEGKEQLTFRQLLMWLYPMSSKEDRNLMVKIAFPNGQEKRKKMNDELTEEEKNELISIFRMYDKDNSGSITREELRKATEDLGMGAAEVEELFETMDENGDEEVTLKEFLRGMKSNYIH